MSERRVSSSSSRSAGRIRVVGDRLRRLGICHVATRLPAPLRLLQDLAAPSQRQVSAIGVAPPQLERRNAFRKNSAPARSLYSKIAAAGHRLDTVADDQGDQGERDNRRLVKSSALRRPGGGHSTISPPDPRSVSVVLHSDGHSSRSAHLIAPVVARNSGRSWNLIAYRKRSPASSSSSPPSQQASTPPPPPPPSPSGGTVLFWAADFESGWSGDAVAPPMCRRALRPRRLTYPVPPRVRYSTRRTSLQPSKAVACRRISIFSATEPQSSIRRPSSVIGIQSVYGR